MPEKIKEWSSQIIWVIGIIFICGMTYQSIGSMDSRVTINTSDIKTNTGLIHDAEVRSMKHETNQINIMNAIQKLDMKLDGWEPVKETE